MKLRQYLYLARKWGWLVALAILLAGGAALFINQRRAPVYQASSTLRISSPSIQGTEYSALLASQQLAQTYTEMLVAQPVLEGVIDNLGLTIAAGSLRGMVEARVIPNTELIVITARNTDPLVARDVANEIPRIFVEQDQELQSRRYAKLKANLTTKMAGLEEEMRSLQAAIADKKAAGARAEDTDLTMLESDLEQARANYATLLQSYGNVELAEVQSGSSVTVTAAAQAPGAPVSPRKLWNTMLAALAGATLAIGVAVLVEYLDDTIKTPDDVQAALGASTLGAVQRAEKGKVGSALLTAQSSRSPVAEAYRVLRTNLRFSDVDNPLGTVLVTSAGPGEGKSTTVANLGVVMAQGGQRVILVDSDMRRPVLHKLFGLPNSIGLTSALVNGALAPEGWLQATQVENLWLVTSGPLPPNPSELLGSQRMRDLVEQMREKADVILFDSPPLIAVTDAAVLAQQVEGTLVVLDCGKTRRGLAEQAMGTLLQVGANVLGVVLNKMSTSKRGYYYYYYYYHRDYARESDEGDGSHRRRRRRGVLRVVDRVLRRRSEPKEKET